jgi:hypothetical protein
MELCEYSTKVDKKSAVSRYTEVLVSKARKESGDGISFPAQNCIEECITRFENKLILWYNDSTGNTKVVDLELD